MGRTPSAADRQAIDAAAVAGVTVTAGQLERWRQAGLIPKATRTFPGGGGSSSSYTDDQLDWIVAAAQRNHSGVSLTERMLWLWHDGYPIDDKTRIATFKSIFDSIREFLDGLTASDDPADRVDQLASKVTTNRHPGTFVKHTRQNAKLAHEFLTALDAFGEEAMSAREFFRATVLNTNAAALDPDGIDRKATAWLFATGLANPALSGIGDAQVDADALEDFDRLIRCLSIDRIEIEACRPRNQLLSYVLSEWPSLGPNRPPPLDALLTPVVLAVVLRYQADHYPDLIDPEIACLIN